MSKSNPWWKKHIEFKSDKIVKMVENSPEEFMVSRTEILQLVLDFKALKTKFINVCHMQDAQDQWNNLSQEEKDMQRAKSDRIGEELRKIWDE